MYLVLYTIMVTLLAKLCKHIHTKASIVFKLLYNIRNKSHTVSINIFYQFIVEMASFFDIKRTQLPFELCHDNNQESFPSL